MWPATLWGDGVDRGEKAAKLFCQGYNCAQSVVLAFEDVTGLEPGLALKLASSFGGGMARMREVCGAVSGMAMVAGLLYGYDSPEDMEGKREHYARIQELAGKFREQTGSIVCREILKDPPSDPDPSPRTAEYYAKRPCARMAAIAAGVLDEYLRENPVK